jgi:hypothetical protein
VNLLEEVAYVNDDAGQTFRELKTKLGLTVVDSIAFDKATYQLSVDATEQLTPTIVPDSFTAQDLRWYSSDENVASVSGGLVTPKKVGTTEVTAGKDGIKTSCTVNVVKKTVLVNVTKNLTNCTADNTSTTTEKDAPYSCTLTADTGYRLSTVTCTMGGAAVDVEGGAIAIGNVTGDIVITAVAEEIVATTFSITKTLGNSTSTNTDTSVGEGDSWSTTITPQSGYKIVSIKCTMGGETVAVNNGKISIDNVSGDIVITVVTAELERYSVSMTLGNSTSSNTSTEIVEGNGWETTISPEDGYAVKTITCTMGGVSVPVSGNTISISLVTGNIVLTVVTEEIQVGVERAVTYGLTNCSTNGPTKVMDGESLKTRINRNENCVLKDISCDMNGRVTRILGSLISIPSVTSDVGITGKATVGQVSVLTSDYEPTEKWAIENVPLLTKYGERVDAVIDASGIQASYSPILYVGTGIQQDFMNGTAKFRIDYDKSNGKAVVYARTKGNNNSYWGNYLNGTSVAEKTIADPSSISVSIESEGVRLNGEIIETDEYSFRGNPGTDLNDAILSALDYFNTQVSNVAIGVSSDADYDTNVKIRELNVVSTTGVVNYHLDGCTVGEGSPDSLALRDPLNVTVTNGTAQNKMLVEVVDHNLTGKGDTYGFLDGNVSMANAHGDLDVYAKSIEDYETQKTVLTSDFAASGRPFLFGGNKVRMYAGGSVEATMDTSTCASSNENIFSVGQTIFSWGTTGGYGVKIHMYYTKSSKTLQVVIINDSLKTNNLMRRQMTIDGDTITLKIGRDGVFVNGVDFTSENGEWSNVGSNKWSSSIFTSLFNEFLVLQDFEIGSQEGTTRSNATYTEIAVNVPTNFNH